MTPTQKTSQSPTFPLTVRRKMVGYQQRLAERIVEARERKGWGRGDLAYHSRLSPKTIERLEEAKVGQPRNGTFRQLADALEVQVADLRPDMETEEKNLRAQLDRMEEKLNELLDLSRPAESLSEPDETGGPPGPPGTRRDRPPKPPDDDEGESDEAA